jgi:hypothetical protein
VIIFRNSRAMQLDGSQIERPSKAAQQKLAGIGEYSDKNKGMKCPKCQKEFKQHEVGDAVLRHYLARLAKSPIVFRVAFMRSLVHCAFSFITSMIINSKRSAVLNMTTTLLNSFTHYVNHSLINSLLHQYGSGFIMPSWR